MLALDEASLAWRRMLTLLAHELHNAVLVGNPAPKVRRIYERISDPQVGDFVYESTTLRRDDSEVWVRGSGFLTAITDEPLCTDEQWEQYKREEPYLTDEDRDYGTERVWYVRYGPSEQDVCRWVNASFLVVPMNPDMFGHPQAGTRDGNATIFTRDGLLGSLADAGFELRDASFHRSGTDTDGK